MLSPQSGAAERVTVFVSISTSVIVGYVKTPKVPLCSKSELSAILTKLMPITKLSTLSSIILVESVPEPSVCVETFVKKSLSIGCKESWRKL